MTTSSKAHLIDILSHSHSALSKIYQAYQVHEKLRQQFEQDIEGEWAGELRFVLYRAGILTLSVRHSALRMRLQYEKTTLIAALREKTTWVGLKDIKIQVSI